MESEIGDLQTTADSYKGYAYLIGCDAGKNFICNACVLRLRHRREYDGQWPDQSTWYLPYRLVCIRETWRETISWVFWNFFSKSDPCGPPQYSASESVARLRHKLHEGNSRLDQESPLALSRAFHYRRD